MKYHIGQLVKETRNGKIVKIIDFEVFEDIILYYTDDKSAYPENQLNEVYDGLNNSKKIKLVEPIISVIENIVEEWGYDKNDKKSIEIINSVLEELRQEKFNKKNYNS